MSLANQKEIMKLFGDSACLQMIYYTDLTRYRNPNYDDTAVARALNWSVRKVADIRRKFIKKGYYFQDKQGNIEVTYLFPEMVHKAKTGNRVTALGKLGLELNSAEDDVEDTLDDNTY